MKISNLKNDFIEGIKWMRKEAPQSLFMWALINGVYALLLIPGAEDSFMRIFNICMFTFINSLFIATTISTGRRQRKLQEIRAEIDYLMDFVGEAFGLENVYVLPSESATIQMTEDTPDKDF